MLRSDSGLDMQAIRRPSVTDLEVPDGGGGRLRRPAGVDDGGLRCTAPEDGGGLAKAALRSEKNAPARWGDTTMQRGDVASEGWPLAIVWECCEGGPPDQLEIG